MTPDLSYDYERENRRAKIINGMEKKKKKFVPVRRSTPPPPAVG